MAILITVLAILAPVLCVILVLSGGVFAARMIGSRRTLKVEQISV